MMMNSDAVVLTRGSKYRLKSLGTREELTETVGIFKGYASLAGDEGMVIELTKEHGEDAGMTRVLPLHMIILIDIIQPVEEHEESREDKTPMFG